MPRRPAALGSDPAHSSCIDHRYGLNLCPPTRRRPPPSRPPPHTRPRADPRYRSSYSSWPAACSTNSNIRARIIWSFGPSWANHLLRPQRRKAFLRIVVRGPDGKLVRYDQVYQILINSYLEQFWSKLIRVDQNIFRGEVNNTKEVMTWLTQHWQILYNSNRYFCRFTAVEYAFFGGDCLTSQRTMIGALSGQPLP